MKTLRNEQMIDLAIESCGLVTAVGLNAPASCAAIRCGLTNTAETRFMDRNGEWIMGNEVPLEKPWRGRAKLVRMAAMAIKECLFLAGLTLEGLESIPVILCLAELDRPGRVQPEDDQLMQEIIDLIGIQFHMDSRTIAEGRVGGVLAIEKAAALFDTGRHKQCMVVATDTYLTAGTLSAYEKKNRILSTDNSDGFIPGEAGAAILVTSPPFIKQSVVSIKGIGFGNEIATIDSGEPLRADGLVDAINKALLMAKQKMGDQDFRICDVSGEQYGFKEAELSLLRILRERKQEFDIWHPSECVGETGSAIGPINLSVASAALKKGYAPGSGILCHFSNDDGKRAALVLNRNNGRL